ncbi:MAG: oligosaccharide flippase family protein, partial [bacterium]|nr:oligosaccharide flippase family protein [bacterium]
GANLFVQGGFLLTGANFFTGFLNYLFNIFIGRSLGPEGFGDITALFSYLVVLSIPLGIVNTVLIQKMSSHKTPKLFASELHAWIISSIKKWWIVLVFILISAPFLPKITSLSETASWAVPLLIICSLLGTFYNTTLQGLHMFYWFTIIGIISTVLKVMGAGIVFLGYGDINVVILFIVISGSLPILITYHVFKKYIYVSEKREILTPYVHKLFNDRQLALTTFSTGALALLNNVDIIFVKKMFSSEDAGIYSSWALFAKLLLFVLGPIITTSYIFFSSNKHKTHHKRTSFILVAFIGLAGLITSLIYRWYGAWIITRLFGNAFIPAIPYLELAAYFGGGYLMMIFMTNYFLAKKSLLSLTPAIMLPFYLGALMLYPQSIKTVMQINIAFTFFAVVILMVGFLKGTQLRNRFQSWFGLQLQK